MRILPITYSMNSHRLFYFHAADLYLDISQELFQVILLPLFRDICHNILFNIQYIEKAFTCRSDMSQCEYDG